MNIISDLCTSARACLQEHPLTIAMAMTAGVVAEAASGVFPEMPGIALALLAWGNVAYRYYDVTKVTNLATWCEEVRGTYEYEQRLEAARRIRECRRIDSTRLDLSQLALTSLPPVIGELTQLQYLDLTNNPITDISSLADLRCLRELVLSNTRIHSIPSELATLPGESRILAYEILLPIVRSFQDAIDIAHERDPLVGPHFETDFFLRRRPVRMVTLVGQAAPAA